MRNPIRVAIYDITLPLITIAALIMIGIMLAWPLWWVSACSVLCLVILQVSILSIVFHQRDSVKFGKIGTVEKIDTVETNNDRTGLRCAAVAVTTTAMMAAAVIGYTQWHMPARQSAADSERIVNIAAKVAEATATFTPAAPSAAINRAASYMAPERAAAFAEQLTAATAPWAADNISAQAQTLAVGVEALQPSAASVAVVLRTTRNTNSSSPNIAVLALRVALTKHDDDWLVLDVLPLSSR